MPGSMPGILIFREVISCLMLDVFNEEAEILIKEGIANLYWYRGDLRKVLVSAGVTSETCDHIFGMRSNSGLELTKRELLEELYRRAHLLSESKRIEISRNFVRILIDHKNFVPQSPSHKVDLARDAAEKLRVLISTQDEKRKNLQEIRLRAQKNSEGTYESRRNVIYQNFLAASKLEGQSRGYALEQIFTEFMKLSGLLVSEPFKITGEQIDGLIRHDGWFFVVELKWVNKQCNQADISSLYVKTEGKMNTRGLFIAMNGYSDDTLKSLSHGKPLSILLLDGVHFANVLSGVYTFKELLDHALVYAAKGIIKAPYGM